MKLFEEFEELREHFTTGWIRFRRVKRKGYLVTVEDGHGDDETEIDVGKITVAAYREHLGHLAEEMDIGTTLESFPAMAPEATKIFVGDLIRRAAEAFARERVPALNLPKERSAFLVRYAQDTRGTAEPISIEAAFAVYVFDKMER